MSNLTKGIVIVFLLLPYGILAQTQLSNQAKVSVITCGPDQEELYSAFGHSAIRVYDPLSGLDLAYNYGVFQFDSKFYLNFTRGHLFYKLGVYPYPKFRDYYISQNRFVHESVLNLNLNQKKKVFNYLNHNSQPEFATYRYDYFYNNCASKVRDTFIELFQDSVIFDGSYITTSYTIRDLTAAYLTQQPWGELGIDLCLGLPMDQVLTPFQYMFLPDYVESGFDHASIDGNPLVKEKILVYDPKSLDSSFSLFHPWVVFGLFLVITLWRSSIDWTNKKLTRWFDILLFSITGSIGVLLLFLWLATDHHAAARNFNLLWAFPFHIMGAIFLAKKQYLTFVKSYFFVVAILTTVMVLCWPIIPQRLNPFLIPVVIALGVRAFTISSMVSTEIPT